MQRRTLWTLYGCNLLASVGFWFFLPLLPIFLSRRGGSATLVGAVFASGLLANALIRYPAGWAADRFGTRPVMIVSLASEAVLFLGYLPHLPLAAFIALRFVHGAAAGAFWPAANGLIAEVAPPKELGRAFGVMQSTNMVGIIIGPAIGGLIALANLSIVFVVAAIVSGLAAIPIATVPNVRLARSAEAPVGALRIARRLLPLIILGVGTSYMIGTFDTIWSLYMTYRGATTLAVGISFATFGIPALLVSARAGALGDRFGADRLIVGSLFVGAVAHRSRPHRGRFHNLGSSEPDRRGEPQRRAGLSRPHPGGVPGRPVIDPDRRLAGGRLPVHHRTRVCVPRHHGLLRVGCDVRRLAQ